MKNNLLLFTLLIISNLCIAQQLNDTLIMGEWNVVNVEITEQVPQKEAVEFVKNAFTGALFNFNGNKIFNIKYGNTADDRIKELFKINGENWKIEDNLIKIGTDGNGFSSMHITVQKVNDNTYFLFPMMRLKMEKIKNDEPKPFKISENINEKPLSNESEFNEPIIIELNENEIVPFPIVDNPPLAPDCKTKWKVEKRKECTSNFIQHHVQRKFNTELAGDLGIVGRIRIDLEFVIDKSGKAVNITATGGPELMNQNAIDVISTLPNLEPATHNGGIVNVSYKLPILFYVEK